MRYMLKTSVLLALTVIGLFGCDQTDSNQNDATALRSIPSPAGSNSSLPHMAAHPEHGLLMSWVTGSDDGYDLLYSLYQNDQWSDPTNIASGDNWFVNWADYPMVAPGNNGKMMAHFLAKSGEATYAYDVKFSTLSDEGWSSPRVVHNDETQTEHGFVSMIPLADGSFQVAWLDGRNTAGSHGEHHGAMTLRTAVVSVTGEITEEFELDNRTCDCCQTGGVLSPTGPLFVYRDRSEMEIRDIYVVRKVDGTWQEPKVVYADQWEIAGCPVNGPRVAASGNALAVAWFAATNGNGQVKMAFSKDNGGTFNAPIVIDSSHPFGRVDVAMLSEEEAVVSWLTMQDDRTVIKAAKVHINGAVDKPRLVTVTTEGRDSGFPQMELFEGKLFFAWTDVSGSEPTINTATWEL